MQVHRNSVFADACAALLPGAASHLPSGPCVISPSFLAASPGVSPTELSSSRTSMQQMPSAASSQVISHSIPGTALSSSMGVQSSTDSGFSPCEAADHATVTGKAIEHDVSPALQEEGEGRGPRKEFFASIGADITSAGCSCDSCWTCSWSCSLSHVHAKSLQLYYASCNSVHVLSCDACM